MREVDEFSTANSRSFLRAQGGGYGERSGGMYRELNSSSGEALYQKATNIGHGSDLNPPL